MITVGYCTIPEALTLLEAHGKSLLHLEEAMLRGELRVYVSVSREYDWEICRVPREDLQVLGKSWGSWLAKGRVPPAPPDPPDYSAAWNAWVENRTGPEPENPNSVLRTYERTRPLIAEQELDRWLGRADSRTGAPGRPSSMSIVLDEFKRRQACNQCEASREAEAKALAAWLKDAHPGLPHPTAKTIQNKLPSSFQPYQNHIPKL